MALISKVWHIGETLFPHKIQMPKMLCTPDDKKVMQQIQAVHSLDANLNLDENALLARAEDILHHATPTTHLVVSKTSISFYFCFKNKEKESLVIITVEISIIYFYMEFTDHFLVFVTC